MDRSERFYLIDQMLNAQRVVPIAKFLEKLEVSRATFNRDIEYLRDRFNAPIVWDRQQRGYRFEGSTDGSNRYALPGLWFSPDEAQALLTLQALISSLNPDLIGPHLAPLRARLKALIGTGASSPEEVSRRIRVVHVGARKSNNQFFQLVASATLNRKRLKIRYFKRMKGIVSERTVSPQRLVFYRDNWYLDAWCHLKNDLRSFALDAMEAVEILNQGAKEMPDQVLDGVLKSGYGMHSNKDVKWAKLRFTPERSRWVSSEQWHPKQRSHQEEDGSFVLEVPYNTDRDLIMDILKHGDQVKVLGPKALVDTIRQNLGKSLASLGQ